MIPKPGSVWVIYNATQRIAILDSPSCVKKLTDSDNEIIVLVLEYVGSYVKILWNNVVGYVSQVYWTYRPVAVMLPTFGSRQL